MIMHTDTIVYDYRSFFPTPHSISSNSVFVDHSAAVSALNHRFSQDDNDIIEQPSLPLPSFIDSWLSSFTSWSTEHKQAALNAIVPL